MARVPWIFDTLTPADRVKVQQARERRAELSRQLTAIKRRFLEGKTRDGDKEAMRTLRREWEQIGEALRRLEDAAILNLAKQITRKDR